MKRNAYRNYYPDSDNSLSRFGEFFSIPVIEEINEKKVDYITDLQPGEAIKYVVYSAEKGFEFYNKNNTSETPIHIEVIGRHIIKLVKFKSAGLDKGLLEQYSNAYIDFEKGEPHTNGNKINWSNAKVGMFNKISSSSLTYERGSFNKRNIFFMKGACALIARFIEKIKENSFCTYAEVFAGTDNKVFLKGYGAYDEVFLFIGNNNYIKDSSGFKEQIYVRNNNVLIEPKLDFDDNLYLMPQYPPLAFDTTIAADGKEGDNFIEVKSVDNVLLGIKFMYLSDESGLVVKRVIGVEGNKILLDSPIKKKEIPIYDGVCFAEPPVENDEYKFDVVKPIKKFSRMVYVSGVDPELSLFGKKIIFYKNDNLLGENYINFYSDIQDLFVLRNVTKEQIDANIAVIPSYKFVDPVTFKIGDEIPNVYIGQKVIVDKNEYTISGFNKNNKTITFLEINSNDLKGKNIITKKIDDEMYKTPVVPFTKLKVLKGKKYLDIIKVEKTDGLKIGAKVKLNDKVSIIDDIKFDDNGNADIRLNKSFVDPILDNKVIYYDYYGDKLEPIDVNELQEELNKFRKDYE